ncbi:hypothetical protein BKA70DRAFT_1406607 [Coprinopsis sp. MPI-PUGE-AT-0042]|nr:hypothetical protein BKA70DRAFT_1406607 [Coprinopsis sp. MPI-PUGE-AT-0042]
MNTTKMTATTLLHSLFIIITLIPFALTCEGECITGVTSVFVGNYTVPVHFTLFDLGDEIDSQIFAGRSPSPPVDYLEPLFAAFDDQKNRVMQKAIFPSFFHGKCQDPSTGINPPGCPNPDCPVVCGTPGSMVHFYPRLRYIAFNSTWHLLHDLTRTGSTVFKQVQKRIEEGQAAAGQPKRRGVDDNRFSPLASRGRSILSRVLPAEDLSVEKRASHNAQVLEGIFQRIRPSLEQICGGTGTGKTNGLPYCSWEQEMKEYILTFP